MARKGKDNILAVAYGQAIEAAIARSGKSYKEICNCFDLDEKSLYRYRLGESQAPLELVMAIWTHCGLEVAKELRNDIKDLIRRSKYGTAILKQLGIK
ncbi:hypothetical protein [Alteromonas sp. a30]|uniref:hypothetical protein n=1 Tax=Alteromonas sp. a30 TaxID=2730917 RepID=UPI00227F6DFA|nr:hypothetical protein [Alteromonas sp. a30]MCY7295086.1 hypothetical protein [Alteromonas sp. a30]